VAAKSVNLDAHSTRAQLADTEEAILVFAVTFREPDRDVDQHELAWWLAQEERMEIRAELATRSSTRGRPALT
jgi:hypothetical protein